MKPYKIRRPSYLQGYEGAVRNVVLRESNIVIGWVWKTHEGWWYHLKRRSPCAEPYCTRADAAMTLWMMATDAHGKPIHVDK